MHLFVIGHGILWQLPCPRHFVHQAGEPAHAQHLVELVLKIIHVKALAPGYLLGKFLNLFLVNLLLGLLNQAEHIAHTEDA